jgi:hypothetical protein
MQRLNLILIVHFVLAFAPLGMQFVPMDALPLLWLLVAVPLSQLLLLLLFRITGTAILRTDVRMVAERKLERQLIDSHPGNLGLLPRLGSRIGCRW